MGDGGAELKENLEIKELQKPEEAREGEGEGEGEEGTLTLCCFGTGRPSSSERAQEHQQEEEGKERRRWKERKCRQEGTGKEKVEDQVGESQ